MDRFAAGMTGRGPTLAEDRETWTGSLHIVDLPGDEAARDFVEREPYQRAGLFADHLVRRFENRLCRTMWEFPGEPAEPRFLVIAAGRIGFPPAAREQLLIHGELADADGVSAGFAAALQAPSRRAVEELLAGARVGPGGASEPAIHDWEPGGRR